MTKKLAAALAVLLLSLGVTAATTTDTDAANRLRVVNIQYRANGL